MTVIISKALRDEMIASAKAKLPEARTTLEKLYLAHAQKVARRRGRKLNNTERARISSHVTQFHSL